MTNQEIIDAVLNSSPTSIKERVPLSTLTSVAESANAILDYEPDTNEFLYGLVNRIAFSFVISKAYQNPMKDLIKGDVPFGTTIQQIQVDAIKALEYDAEDFEQTLFKTYPPSVVTIYHEMNRQNTYPVSISLAQLKQAFVSEGGLMNLVNGAIQEMTSSDEDDTFQLTKSLFLAYGVAGNFRALTVPTPADKASVEECVIAIKTESNNFTFRSSDYNSAGVRTFCRKEDQTLFINSNFDARIDVSYLAQIFNMSVGEVEARKIVVDDFGGLENVVAVLADNDWLQIWDNENQTRTVENGKSLTTNYFRHHWQTLSTNRCANATLFLSVEPDLTGIDVLPATASVAKKGTKQFTVDAQGTGYPSNAVTWSHDGNSERTKISPLGLLLVGSDETQNPLTITATSKVDELITDTAVVTVV